MYCVFDKTTKMFTGTAIRWKAPEISTNEVVINLPDIPDDTVRLNNAEDGVRPATTPELQADADAKKDAQADSEINTDTVRIILETIIPMIQDGSINTKTPVEVLDAAKTKRRNEL